MEKWLIEDRVPGKEIGIRAIVDDNGYTICEPSPMGESNARLIANAPLMLDALCKISLAEPESSSSAVEKVRDMAKIARAAIRKATGEEV